MKSVQAFLLTLPLLSAVGCMTKGYSGTDGEDDSGPIISLSKTTGTVNQPFYAKVEVRADGWPAFAVNGDFDAELPPGISSSGMGSFGGTPTKVGTYRLTIYVKNETSGEPHFYNRADLAHGTWYRKEVTIEVLPASPGGGKPVRNTAFKVRIKTSFLFEPENEALAKHTIWTETLCQLKDLGGADGNRFAEVEPEKGADLVFEFSIGTDLKGRYSGFLIMADGRSNVIFKGSTGDRWYTAQEITKLVDDLLNQAYARLHDGW